MQRDFDERDRHDSRFPLPPERPSHRSAFLHGLPPPMPPSPRGYYPPSPGQRDVSSPSGGMTDPNGWSSGPHMNGGRGGMEREMSSASSARSQWSPPPMHMRNMSPRMGDRLPPLADYPPMMRHHWDSTPHVLKPSPHPPHDPNQSPRSHPSSFRAPGTPGPEQQRESAYYRPPTAPSRANTRSPESRAVNGSVIATPEAINGNATNAPSNPNAAANGTKHPAPAASATDPPSEPPKKKKRRQAFSCAECAKRKQKCNRETPCQHCVNRKVPHLCIPSSRLNSPPSRSKPAAKADGDKGTVPGKADERATTTPMPALGGRVSRIERMLNAVLNRIDGLDSTALADWRLLHARAESPPPPGGDAKRPSLQINGSSNGSIGSMASMQSSIAGSVGGALAGNDTLANQVVDNGPWSVLQRTSQTDLPPHEEANALISFFFSDINDLHYPIDKRAFLRAYDALYTSNLDEQTSPATLTALPLVYAVLAFAYRLAPDELVPGGERDRLKRSQQLVWNAKCTIPLASSISEADATQLVEARLIEARIILGLYQLQVERALEDAWVTFRTAIAMGTAINLHRDGSQLGLDAQTTEYRRRLWSYLCHADATTSAIVSHPMTINPTSYDADTPSNIDLENLRVHAVKPKSMEEPTTATFIVLRSQLAHIVGRITSQFQRLRGSMHYDEVLSIDRELQDFTESLPPQFRILDTDTSKDQDLPSLAAQRFFIQSEILHYGIVLHRPWALRDFSKSPEKHAHSRNRLIEAAILTLKVRGGSADVKIPEVLEPLLSGSTYDFNSAFIAGLGLHADPSCPRCPDLWDIMEKYTRQHPYDPDNKETVIVYTFYRRALQDKENRCRGGSDSARPTVANLLVNNKHGDDDPQVLIDQFLSANAGFIESRRPRDLTALGFGAPSDPSPGSIKNENSEEKNPSLSIGAVPARLIKVQDGQTVEEVNTPEFFNRLIDAIHQYRAPQ